MPTIVRTALAGVRNALHEALLLCLPDSIVCRSGRHGGTVDLEGVIRRARRHRGPVVVGTTF